MRMHNVSCFARSPVPQTAAQKSTEGLRPLQPSWGDADRLGPPLVAGSTAAPVLCHQVPLCGLPAWGLLSAPESCLLRALRPPLLLPAAAAFAFTCTRL